MGHQTRAGGEGQAQQTLQPVPRQSGLHIKATTGNRVWTPKRANQQAQNPPAFDRLLDTVRQRIEGVFHALLNTERNLERLLSKQKRGLHVRVAAQIAALVYHHVLHRCFGLDVLSFSISH